MQNPDLLLEVQRLDVALTVSGMRVSVIEKVDFDVRRGSTLGIVGESGSGKSLLCRSLLRLLPEEATISGQVKFYWPDGSSDDLLSLAATELRRIRGKAIGLLFQESNASMNPVVKCGRQLFDALPAPLQKDKKAGMQRVHDLFRLVGLANEEQVADSYPHELSGGMVQRVALAAALAGEPALLIADEPTTGLDPEARSKILGTLQRLQRELGLSLILVSHDLGIVSQWADDLLVMYWGRMVEHGETEKVMSSPSHPYTKALLEAELSFQTGGLPKAIPGEAPGVENPPTGCRFHPRCIYAEDKCKIDEPSVFAAAHGGGTRCYYPLA